MDKCDVCVSAVTLYRQGLITWEQLWNWVGHIEQKHPEFVERMGTMHQVLGIIDHVTSQSVG